MSFGKHAFFGYQVFDDTSVDLVREPAPCAIC